MRLVFDIEADGLEPTKIFCIVAQDVQTKEIFEFPPDKLKQGVELLESASELIGHNIIGYDLYWLDTLMGTKLLDHPKILDTLVLSRLFNPTREGGHSLGSWGYRLKHAKGDHDDFDEYTPAMLEYCKNDVVLNTKIYWHLRQHEAAGFSRSAFECETEVQKIICKQQRHGFKLDVPKLERVSMQLNSEILEAESKVHETFKPKVNTTILFPSYTKSGSLSKFGIIQGTEVRKRLTDDEYKEMEDKGYVKRVSISPFNISSTKQRAEYLQEFGWKPTKFTDKGAPMVSDDILMGIKDIPEAETIAEFLRLKKINQFFDQWVESYDPETHRMHGFVNPLGTITNRMSHSKPNMGQIPSIRKKYGYECRDVWIVEDGNVLVGGDASGLELRMLAHYINDATYTEVLINGDVHTHNQNAAGLGNRDQAKTFIYAYLYGAGDAKIGKIVGGNKRDGARLKQQFLASMPQLKHLQDTVKKSALKGYVTGLDKRKILIRSPHAALNSLLQSAGAIVMKYALIILENKIQENNWDAHFCANVHDEFQVECPKELGDLVGQAIVDSIIEAGEVLNLNCPLDGEYKIGSSWAETH